MCYEHRMSTSLAPLLKYMLENYQNQKADSRYGYKQKKAKKSTQEPPLDLDMRYFGIYAGNARSLLAGVVLYGDNIEVEF